MARRTLNKGVHTCPERAGPQNIDPIKDTIPKAEDPTLLGRIMIAGMHGIEKGYTSRWSDEDLMRSVLEFFKYCKDEDLKPTIPLLKLWIGISDGMFHDWRHNTAGKYESKSKILGFALKSMESYLQADMDEHPKGSMFILKTSFGHSEVQKVQIESKNNVSKDEIDGTLAKLGLKE